MSLYKKDIDNALKVLREGGIILYPSDTVWGIGCDATNSEAVSKIYELKKRSDSKSMLVLIDSENRISQYVDEVPEVAWQILEVNDKPLTIIYPNAKNLARNIISEDGSIGIRLTKDDFCNELIFRFRKPIISTSANISGEEAPSIFDEISEEIKLGVDYIVGWRQEDINRSKPSGIIKIGLSGEIQIIRE